MPQLTWLITGCSSGLGEIFVRSILSRGDKVIATARGDASRMSTLADAGAKTFSLDVTAPQSEINAVMEAILETESVDVLVNNAGYIEAGLAEETSYENYVEELNTNFLGVVKVTQAVMPHLRRKRSGTVVFIGSVGGIAGDPGAAAYCASKAALYGWYDCFRKETIHLNVRSVLFELGFFRTKMFHPDNIKNRPNVIEDYDEVRNAVSQFIHDINGTQSGDPRKAVEIMLDVVKGEGTAKGRQMPHRLPLGPDCVARMRQTCAESLAICDEWEDLICNTNFT